MPPRSTKSKIKEGEVVPSSRRSARLALPPPPAAESKTTSAKGKGNKKRPADEAESSTTINEKSNAKKTKIVKDLEVEIKVNAKTAKSDSASQSKSKPGKAEAAKATNGNEDKKEEDGGKGSILKRGDRLPSITLENEDGEVVDIGGLTGGGKGVVIFVYPKADTPGCTNQACGFRDHLAEIQGKGYEIYGLSKDKPAALKRWKIKKGLNYTLLSDPQSRLIKRLGAFLFPNNSCRSHFIFDPQGKLVDIAIKVKPADDPKKCLEFIKTLHA